MGTLENRPLTGLDKNTKLATEFKDFAPSEFLFAEEMPQTPPTKPPSFSNMDVFICGLSALRNGRAIIHAGPPPSRVCLETERKKPFPDFILFVEVSQMQNKENPFQTKDGRFFRLFFFQHFLSEIQPNRNSAEKKKISYKKK